MIRRSFRFSQYRIDRNYFSVDLADSVTADRTLFFGALIVSGYLAKEERGSSAALTKAIEAVVSDIELDLQSETAERTRARV
jgi:hypothetical protein